MYIFYGVCSPQLPGDPLQLMRAPHSTDSADCQSTELYDNVKYKTLFNPVHHNAVSTLQHFITPYSKTLQNSTEHCPCQY